MWIDGTTGKIAAPLGQVHFLREATGEYQVVLKGIWRKLIGGVADILTIASKSSVAMLTSTVKLCNCGGKSASTLSPILQSMTHPRESWWSVRCTGLT